MGRYTRRAFPPYRFLPGRTPHPTRDPEGHSYGRQHPEPVRFDAGKWFQCEEYLFGVDLFNHGYWWEAHEAFEPLWIAVGRTSADGYFLQGLIQIAAGMLKRELGHSGAARALCEEGLEKLRLKSGVHLGVDIDRFSRAVRDALGAQRAQPPRLQLTGHDRLG